MIKNPPTNARDLRDAGSIPGSRRSSGWQPIPVFFPGESHGQRNLAGYRLQGRKESDMTEGTKHAHIDLYSNHYKFYMF